ncbi:M6 family metalloprotease domain-containing protein [Streptomyces sp. NPDC091292]|uniref:M6 family metalloprotease domain-containing protein n=1 Tax=Streptomyces sp. NPDC091292 TaxID=3365991 RepID=UPI0038015648
MSRHPHPEVAVPRQHSPTAATLGGPERPEGPGGSGGRVRDRSRLRSTAAAFTSLTALAATSLVAGPAVAQPFAGPCALERSAAHHSEGLDTWNAAYPRPARTLNAVMVFLSFPDARPLTTPAELTADYFPATSRFYEQASYGKFTLQPHPQREWIRMPKPSTAYAIRRDWDPAHRSAYLRDAVAAADPEVDFRKFDVVYFVADPDAPGVDSDATKVVNFDRPMEADGTSIRRIVTVFERHPPDRNVLAHETGHVFDLPDLYHRPTDGKGDWDTYVGDWDVMGSQFGLAPDFFAWHKWKLGWLEPRQVVCVQGRGSTRLTMEPLSAGPGGTATGVAPGPGGTGAEQRGPEGRAAVDGKAADPVVGGAAGGVGATGRFGAGSGTKLAVVRTGRTSAIAIEARGAVGNDAATCTEGLLIYRVRSETASGAGPVEVIDAHPGSEACWGQSVYPALADAPVRAGESFTVPDEKVRIVVDAQDRTENGDWSVKITTG